jgi:hypothetical protein
MKSVLILAFAFPFLVSSQDHGINWILGYGNKSDSSFLGRTIFNFQNDTLAFTRNSGGIIFDIGFETNSYSDYQGVLRFFHDGFKLGNAIDFKIVENGDSINPGKVWEAFYGGFYPSNDVSVFLPPEKSDSILLLIHMPLDFSTYDNYTVLYSPSVYVTRININANNAKGRVISKNESILKGNFSPMVFSCCKHSNGRDWWIILKSNLSSTYYKLLISNNGVSKIDSQMIGEATIDFSINGNSSFSPNGEKFVRIGYRDGLQVFDFDRCEGKLSNFVQIINDSIKPSFNLFNVAISSNSRFLYASTSSKIYQYDLENSNIESSEELIGEWDGFIYNKFYTTSFFNLQLAPDGKIYISCYSGNIYLHRINQPNLKGTACNFKLRDVVLPTYIAGGMGNYPNYLLRSEEGTICDSLISSIINSNNIYEIYPNPSNGNFVIYNHNKNFSNMIEIKIVNLSGQIIYQKTMPQNIKKWNITLETIKPGLYFIQLYSKNKVVQSSKLVVN